MVNTKAKSPDFRKGYKMGYKAGYMRAQRKLESPNPHPQMYEVLKANWVLRKGNWYCSNCDTKNEQAHNEFCCKCGAEMSEEADYEDN